MSELLLHDVAAPIRKEAGEPKEVHEARLGGAGTVLDVVAYVDEFNVNGMNLKQVLRSMLTSEDFVRF